MLYLSLETRGGGGRPDSEHRCGFSGLCNNAFEFLRRQGKERAVRDKYSEKKCSKLTEDFKFPPSHSDDETGCSRERRVQNFVGSQVSRGITASCRRPALSRLFETMARIGTMAVQLLRDLTRRKEP